MYTHDDMQYVINDSKTLVSITLEFHGTLKIAVSKQ